MNSRRLILAFLVSPLMTPLTFIVTVMSRNSPQASLDNIPLIFALYAPFAYAAVAIFGIPAFLLFRFLVWKSAIAFMLAGAVIGLITDLLISNLLITWSVASGDFGWSALAGAMSGFIFWLILFWQQSSPVEQVPTAAKSNKRPFAQP